MQGRTGHSVLTEAGHVLSVAHVRVDTVVRPFQCGPVDQLRAWSVSAQGTTIDLAVFVLLDENLASILLGAEIQQMFPGMEIFLASSICGMRFFACNQLTAKSMSGLCRLKSTS